MTIKEMLSGLQTKLQKLKGNKLAPFSYEQTAYDNDTVEGTDTYDFSKEQNIPIANADVLQVNPTILSKGFRSQVSSLPRMLLNHFFGRTSYNLNKIVDFVEYLTTSLTSLFDKAGGIPTLDSETLLSLEQLPKGSFCYRGEWNAETNTPQLTHGVGKKGDVYKVVKAGSQTLGSSDEIYYAINSFVFNTGDKWLVLGGGSGTVVNINSVSADNEGNLTLKAEHIPYNTEKNVKETIEAITTGSWSGTQIEETIKTMLRKMYPDVNKEYINSYQNKREFRNVTDELPFGESFEKIAKGDVDIQLGDYWLLMPNFDEEAVNIILNHQKEHITLKKYEAKGHSLAYNILEALKDTGQAADKCFAFTKAYKDCIDNTGVTLEEVTQKAIEAENELANLDSCLAFLNMYEFFFGSEFDKSFFTENPITKKLEQFNNTVGLSEEYLNQIAQIHVLFSTFGSYNLKEILLKDANELLYASYQNKKICKVYIERIKNFLNTLTIINTVEDLQYYNNENVMRAIQAIFQVNINIFTLFCCKHITKEEALELAKHKIEIFYVNYTRLVWQPYFVVFAGYGFAGEAKFICTNFGNLFKVTNNSSNGGVFPKFIKEASHGVSSKWYLLGNQDKLTSNTDIDLREYFLYSHNKYLPSDHLGLYLFKVFRDYEKVLRLMFRLPNAEFTSLPKICAFSANGLTDYSLDVPHQVSNSTRFFENKIQKVIKYSSEENGLAFEELATKGYNHIPLLANLDSAVDYFDKGKIRELSDLYRRFNFGFTDIVLSSFIVNLKTDENESFRTAFNKLVLRASCFAQNSQKGLFPDFFNREHFSDLYREMASFVPVGNRLSGNSNAFMSSNSFHYNESLLSNIQPDVGGEVEFSLRDFLYITRYEMFNRTYGLRCTYEAHMTPKYEVPVTSFCLNIDYDEIQKQKTALKYSYYAG